MARLVYFDDVMDDGVEMSDNLIKTLSMQKPYPNYLDIFTVVTLTLDSRIDPTNLYRNCAYVYGDNLYVTDSTGNIAYIDCEMCLTSNAKELKRTHPEYKKAGGKRAKHENMDAGHLGVQLGQHPSIAMEQDAIMNRYGTWRVFERNWVDALREGHTVNVKAVFVEDNTDSTFSPFWCIRETISGQEPIEQVLLNEPDQF